MPYDCGLKFKLCLRRARTLWKYKWADWGVRPINGGRQFVPPGHFYSPIPALNDIRANENSVFCGESRNIPGLDLHEEEPLRQLCEFKKYYNELPFHAKRNPPLRYFFDNPAYSYSDAIVLYYRSAT
jgi:hypothetical protein